MGETGEPGAAVTARGEYHCPACGAEAHWNPARQALVCTYCGTESKADLATRGEATVIVEHDLVAALRDIPDSARGWQSAKTSVRCQSCQAISVFDEGRVGQRCDFCGSAALVPYEQVKDAFRPESLLPLRVSEAQARDRIRAWFKGLWFVPGGFAARALTDTIKGVYVPYWTFDAQADATWTAEAGHYYYEEVRGRRERRTCWTPASGSLSHAFDDDLVCASRGVEPRLLRAVEPFPNGGLVPYDPGYLAGWLVERYQIDLVAAAGRSRQQMDARLRALCAARVPGDTQRNLVVRASYRGQTFKHILAPLWLATYTHGGRGRQVVVNGVTDRVAGDRPWSWVKIALAALAALAIAYLICGSASALSAAEEADEGDEARPEVDGQLRLPLEGGERRLDLAPRALHLQGQGRIHRPVRAVRLAELGHEAARLLEVEHGEGEPQWGHAASDRTADVLASASSEEARMAHADRSPFGEHAAPALRIAGAVFLAGGMVHLYADRVIFDAPTFGAGAARSLADPRVSAFVAERIADEVIAQKRDLVAYRPLLAGTARTVISSGPFRAGFRRAAERAHAALFSEGAERVALSVPDLGVLVRSALAHDPALAARIPPGMGGGVLVQPSGRVAGAFLELVRLGHRFRRNAFLAIGGGVALLLLGILLPRERRRALLSGGAVLATAALVLFFLPPLARTALTASVPNPELRPVVAGAWDAFAGGLRVWALVLAGMGVVLAAAASSFASHFEIEEVGRRVWLRLRRPALTWPGEVVRAALLTGVGLFAALRPTDALRVLAVVGGALLAFEGIRELFLLVPPRVKAAARQAGDALGEARERGHEWEGARTLARAVVVGLLVVLLIGGAVLFMQSPAATPAAPALTDACNGDPALCGRRLDEIVLAGAHNSMSAAEFDGWMFPNQERGTVALLDHGIRALLFDVHYGTPIGGRVKTDLQDEEVSTAKFEKAVGREAVAAAMRIRDRLTGKPTGPRGAYLCHGFCELGALPLVTVLEGVRDFLVRNPGEVVVFVIEDYVAPSDLARAFEESGLLRFVYRGGVEPPLPTLREMIDTNQRLVVFGENDPAGVDWLHPAFETIQETPYTFHVPEEFSCRPNRGGPDAPLFQINHWIETTPTPRPSNAEIVNTRELLLARARQCQEERGRLPNILAVDFAMTGDVVGAAAELNGLESAGDGAGGERSAGAG